MLTGKLLTLAIALFQARTLGVALYGELSIIQNTVAVFSVFASAAAGGTCSKYISELIHTDKRRAEEIVTLSVLTNVFFCIIGAIALSTQSQFLANTVLQKPELQKYLTTSAFILAATSISGTFSGILLGFKLYRLEAALRLSQIIIWLAATLLLSSYRQLEGPVLALIVSSAYAVISLGFASWHALTSHQFRPRLLGTARAIPVLYRFSLPIMLQGAITIPTQYLCSAALARTHGGYVQLGLFSAGMQTRVVLIQLPMMIQITLGPMLSEMFGRNETAKFFEVFRTVLSGTSTACSLIALTMIVLGPELLGLFGKTFSAGPGTFSILIIYGLLASVGNLLGMALQMYGRAWLAIAGDILFSAIALPLGMILVPGRGAQGLGLALAIAALGQTTILFLGVGLCMRSSGYRSPLAASISAYCPLALSLTFIWSLIATGANPPAAVQLILAATQIFTAYFATKTLLCNASIAPAIPAAKIA